MLQAAYQQMVILRGDWMQMHNFQCSNPLVISLGHGLIGGGMTIAGGPR